VEVFQNVAHTPYLESIVFKHNKFINLSPWLARLAEIESQVCRIETGVGYGTGFLVGSNVVITNYHVMERVIKNNGTVPSNVVLRFDYKQLPDGVTVYPGTEFRLSTSDWLIDSSPYATTNNLPQPDQLDYALLRVAGSPGDQPRGGSQSGSSASSRGWVKIPEQPYDFQPSTMLIICNSHDLI
jgi:Trypsin-like peptidase domain